MPVYLFTFHGYRTWMPDHRRGYVRRKKGILPRDEKMAENYARRAKNQEETRFDEVVARVLLQELIDSCSKIGCRFHGGTVEVTHVHAVVSWMHERGWMSVRTSLKTSLTKRLKAMGEGLSLSRGGSRKRVKDRKHLDYLMTTYLPRHVGVGWYEDRGWVVQRGRKRGRR